MMEDDGEGEDDELLWVMMEEKMRVDGEGVEVDFGFDGISAA